MTVSRAFETQKAAATLIRARRLFPALKSPRDRIGRDYAKKACPGRWIVVAGQV